MQEAPSPSSEERSTRSAPRCLLWKRRPEEMLQRYAHHRGALSPSVSPGLLPAQWRLYWTSQSGWGSVGQVGRRLSYRTGRTGRTSRTALSIDLQFPPSCPARLSRPSAPSSPHTGTRKGCTAGRSGLSRTSQTAPILSDESDKSDKSDAAEYRPAAPSQLPRPAPAARLPSWLPGVLPADLGGRDRARPIG